MTSRICLSIPMPFVNRGVWLRRTALAVLLLASSLSASPVRVATLGGESRLLLDSTNLFDYPALVRQLAHADIELFDDWAGIALPVGKKHGVALFLNRPDAGLDELSAYLSDTGSRLFRALEPKPWFDAIYGLQLRQGLSLGIGARYAYDVRDRGLEEASVSRWDSRLGLCLASGHRRLDATLYVENLALHDRELGTNIEADGKGYGIDLRGRWPIGETAILLPSIRWRQADIGLSPEERQVEELTLALSANVRPAPTVLGVLGIVVAGNWQSTDISGDGLSGTKLRRWLLPAVVAGGEVQVGSLLLRLGARHESVLEEIDGPGEVDLYFDNGFVTDVGLGIEFGDFVLDGMLEKDFLRDGPHFLGGSSRGGGLLANISLLYRLYP